jgi:hypothetical protein
MSRVVKSAAKVTSLPIGSFKGKPGAFARAGPPMKKAREGRHLGGPGRGACANARTRHRIENGVAPCAERREDA